MNEEPMSYSEMKAIYSRWKATGEDEWQTYFLENDDDTPALPARMLQWIRVVLNNTVRRCINDKNFYFVSFSAGDRDAVVCTTLNGKTSRANAVFIASAHNRDIPRLINEVVRLRKENEQANVEAVG